VRKGGWYPGPSGRLAVFVPVCSRPREVSLPRQVDGRAYACEADRPGDSPRVPLKERRATGRFSVLTRADQEPCLPGRPPFLSAREGCDMGHVRLSQHIDAPIDHVWDIAASCARLPEWNVQASAGRYLIGAPVEIHPDVVVSSTQATHHPAST
jgi:hypothetical protein